jgi:hypothetical protein
MFLFVYTTIEALYFPLFFSLMYVVIDGGGLYHTRRAEVEQRNAFKYSLAFVDLPTFFICLAFLVPIRQSSIKYPNAFTDGIGAGILLFSGWAWICLMVFFIAPQVGIPNAPTTTVPNAPTTTVPNAPTTTVPSASMTAVPRGLVTVMIWAWAIHLTPLMGLAWFFQTPALGRGVVLSVLVAVTAALAWRDANDQHPDGTRGWTMKKRIGWMAGLLVVFGAYLALVPRTSPASELKIIEADISAGRMVIVGQTSQPNESVLIDNHAQNSDADGRFRFESTDIPETCRVTVQSGNSTLQEEVIGNCARPGRPGVPGAIGEKGPSGPQGNSGPPGDSEIFDADAHSAKLCGLQDKCSGRNNCKPAPPSMIVLVPKSWSAEACQQLFSISAGVSKQVRLGCLFRDRPFVTWRDGPVSPPGQANCGW